MVGVSLGRTPIGGKEFRWGERTFIMGVINMTPDSFSGDGWGEDVEGAAERALRFQEEGADLIDVGGQSTRPPGAVYGPGAQVVPTEEEMRRVVPLIHRLAKVLRVPFSIDTFRAEVARRAVADGASLINDVWGGRKDPHILRVAAQERVPIVLVHNQEGYDYTDFMGEVIGGLRRSMAQAVEAGVPPENLIVDPGFGFGKRAEHNLELLRRLDEVKAALQRPLLLGTSRKSTIGRVLGGLPPGEREEGTAATIALAIAKGADIVRVHNVRGMARAVRMADAVVRG